VADLRQEEDVLDTWFSSWIWPITSFDGINSPENEDIKYYYPTNVLITAPDILFFWVARMIIAGYEFRDQKPFNDVYLTGMVRDKQKRKMSKSLGNSPDPISLIEQYGADGVRVGMLLCAPAGNDLLYDDSLPEQGRNFANKIWNAFRLVKTMDVDEAIAQPESSVAAILWMNATINKTLAEVDENFSKYRISDALMQVYKLFWDDFSGWYLEIIKPEYRKPMDGKTHRATLDIFGTLMKVIHPFMPFITEEIWQRLDERSEGSSIMVQPMPASAQFSSELLGRFDLAREIVSAVRTVRKEKNIPLRESLVLCTAAGATGDEFDSMIIKMCNLSEIRAVQGQVENSVSFRIGTSEFYIPLVGTIDSEEELRKLTEELKYTEGFLEIVMSKLSNERFVSNAPEKVLSLERKKQADAEAKIVTLKESIARLGKD